MKIPKLIWFIVGLVFGFHSLDTLVEESHEVIYEKSDKTENVQGLICVQLKDLHPNKTKVDLVELRDDLYRRLNSSDQYSFWKKEIPYMQKGFEKLILDRTKSGSYLILNGKFCLIENDSNKLGIMDYLLSFPYFSKYPRQYYAIQRETLDFVKMKTQFDQIIQLTVLKRKHPYSDCDESNSRFFCLNACFKRRFRLARYFYSSSETGLIHLNYSDRNDTIKESERICFEKCKRENCKMVQLIAGYGRRSGFSSETFEARSKLSEFDYWLQFVGLVCTFAGLSFHELTSIAIEFSASKVRRRKVRIALLCLKWAILFHTLIFFGYLCTWKVLDHKAEVTEKETRNLIQPEIVRLAACVKINENVDNEYEGKTMSEIERATDEALHDVLEASIRTNYRGRSFRTKYQFKPKVLFFHEERCFLLSVYPYYQVIPSKSKLIIKNNKSIYIIYFLYILSENEDLNAESFLYSGDIAFLKRVVRRLKSSGRCVNYVEKNGNCTGRRNCVERCIARDFLERHNKIPLEKSLVIYRDWFSPTEWNTTHLKITGYEDNKIYQNISDECLQKISNEKPCNEIEFEETVETNEEEIGLPFDVVQSVEERPSWYKLALDLVSITGILFGRTVLGSLKMVGSFIQTRLRMRESKTVLFVIYLLCSVGAIWQTYHIFHLVVSGDLTSTRYYELATEVRVPELVFCRQVDQSLINRNHKLTGNYLEELTMELTAESMFSNITYLDKSNEWIPFDHSLVAGFLLLDLKCFRIKINQTYQRNQFHFSNESQILKVNFTKLPQRWTHVHFMTKSQETGEFSKIVNLKYSNYFKDRYSITHETSPYVYEDRFSFIRKHFSSFQKDDSDPGGQLLELKSNEHHLKTLNLPLEKEGLEFEINEDLFEQLYLIQNQKNRKRRTNYQQLFVTNQLRTDKKFESDFLFDLLFLQRIVYSTNEENLGQIILNLLNVLSIWFDLGVLDLPPVLVLTHDRLLIYLYLHLPLFLFGRITEFLLFSSKWLKKIESPLYELLKPRN